MMKARCSAPGSGQPRCRGRVTAYPSLCIEPISHDRDLTRLHQCRRVTAALDLYQPCPPVSAQHLRCDLGQQKVRVFPSKDKDRTLNAFPCAPQRVSMGPRTSKASGKTTIITQFVAAMLVRPNTMVRQVPPLLVREASERRQDRTEIPFCGFGTVKGLRRAADIVPNPKHRVERKRRTNIVHDEPPNRGI